MLSLSISCMDFLDTVFMYSIEFRGGEQAPYEWKFARGHARCAE
jgi:hypothetical protein